jgi:di/tricarboxylate transporter
MTAEQLFLVALLACVLAAFAWGRVRYDIVAFVALLVAALMELVPVTHVFSGFGHPATVTVALVLVLGRGLQNAGAVDFVTRRLVPSAASATRQVATLSGMASALSAVMNNVGALVLLMPVALQAAAKSKLSPAILLMPLSFATILGGITTLIGTPPNIIVASFRGQSAGEPFAMFDFAPVGVLVAVAGVAFIVLIGWRLIPTERRAKLSPKDLFDIEAYISELTVPEKTRAVGKTLDELDQVATQHDAAILHLIRRSQRIDRGGRREAVRAGDVLVVEAGPDALDALLSALELKVRGRRDKKGGLFGSEESVSEAVVPPRSRVVGRTVASLALPQRHGVNLLAVSRQGKSLSQRLANVRLEAGDVLLLEGESERLSETIVALGGLPLAGRGLQRFQPRRAGMAIVIFAGAILAAMLGLLTLPVALAVAAASMVLAGIVSPREIYDSIDWTVVVLIGAMLPLGEALQVTGTTRAFAQGLLALSSDVSPVVLLALVMIITMALSDVMNNAATAVVMSPIALGVAEQLGVNADAFLMAVAIGSSCAFLTPIGHQNNILILGPGGYRFGDYWRMGLPLEMLVLAVSIPMLVWVWPL